MLWVRKEIVHLKYIKFIIAIISLLSLSWGIASADSTSATGGTNGKSGQGRMKRQMSLSTNNNPSPGNIRGHCTLLEGGGNPFLGPCVNTQLILSTVDGKELLRTRTTPNGDFEFIADQGGQFIITPGSKLYEVASPTKAVLSGQGVDLKIRQK